MKLKYTQYLLCAIQSNTRLFKQHSQKFYTAVDHHSVLQEF